MEMFRSDLIKFENLDKIRQFDGAVNWPEMHTYTRKLMHFKFNLQFIYQNITLLSCCCIKKEGCSHEIVQSFT